MEALKKSTDTSPILEEDENEAEEITFAKPLPTPPVVARKSDYNKVVVGTSSTAKFAPSAQREEFTVKPVSYQVFFSFYLSL